MYVQFSLHTKYMYILYCIVETRKFGKFLQMCKLILVSVN